MTFLYLYNIVRVWLRGIGGIETAADLGLDGWPSGGYEPCPCAFATPRQAALEAALCPVTCSNS